MTATNLLSQKIDRLLTAWSHAKKTVSDEQKRLDQAKLNLAEAEQAQKALQAIAEAVQQKAHSQIATVVSSGLEAVWPEDPYSFRIVFEQKRGRTEARPVFVRNGHELEPRHQAGGGCVAIAAFCLRLACIKKAVPRKRPLLILDEPFVHLSPDLKPLVPSLLMQSARKLGVQIVVATNEPLYRCGKIVQLD